MGPGLDTYIAGTGVDGLGGGMAFLHRNFAPFLYVSGEAIRETCSCLNIFYCSVFSFVWAKTSFSTFRANRALFLI